MNHELPLRSGVPPPARSLTPSVAHEIKNPLNALLNLLYLVETEPYLTDSGRHYLELAREEVQRLTSFVHHALDKCHDTTQREQTSIPGLLDEVVELYRAQFDASGVVIESRYCQNGRLSVFPLELRRTFSNLLLNAADAMSGGGKLRVRVRPACEWSGQARRGLRVTISDSGSGITADVLPKIFQPFFSTKGEGGIGMGLSLVKDAVKHHGGVIHVRSTTQAGRSGSVFAIFLPAV